MDDDLRIPMQPSFGGARAAEALVPAALDVREAPVYTTSELLPLLFSLSLAIVLPPDAIIAPPGVDAPSVRAAPLAARGAEAVQTVLERPTMAVGAGHVLLGEVDRRLYGLVVRLNAYRITEAPTVLISTGLVTAEPSAQSGGWATPRRLWELARDTLFERGQLCEPVAELGEDAFMTMRGARTAQVAWLNDERLASVGVTSLHSPRAWVIAAARGIAELASGHQPVGVSAALRLVAASQDGHQRYELIHHDPRARVSRVDAV